MDHRRRPNPRRHSVEIIRMIKIIIFHKCNIMNNIVVFI
uniref:Uncharacterized protein n=1 Tax=mine drainage metagenome TaxID=410659 RepID=E6QLC1_9ZZZZ